MLVQCLCCREWGWAQELQVNMQQTQHLDCCSRYISGPSQACLSPAGTYNFPAGSANSLVGPPPTGPAPTGTLR